MLLKRAAISLDVECPPGAHVFAQLVSSWWHYVGGWRAFGSWGRAGESESQGGGPRGLNPNPISCPVS